MPHCIVEYSQSLTQQTDIEKLLHTVSQTVSSSPLFEPANVSTRGQSYTDYLNGTGNKDFIHITIRLFGGRTDEDKMSISNAVGEALKALGFKDTLISCECVDIHKPSSFRSVK